MGGLRKNGSTSLALPHERALGNGGAMWSFNTDFCSTKTALIAAEASLNICCLLDYYFIYLLIYLFIYFWDGLKKALLDSLWPLNWDEEQRSDCF